MNKETLLALMCYALDRDLLSLPVSRVLQLFKNDAAALKKTYSDPEDELLYIKGIENVEDIDFFTDYVLCYSKMDSISGLRDYGKYNEELIKYETKN